MVFIWEKTKLGKIGIDGDFLKTLISRRLTQEIVLQEISFAGETGQLNVFMAVSDQVSEASKNEIEKKLSSPFKGSGIKISCHWMVVVPEKKEEKKDMLHLPLFWAAVCAGICALVHIGIRGILWSLFFGVIGYGAGWACMTEQGRELVSDIASNIIKKINKK